MIPVNFAKGWVRFAPFTINYFIRNIHNIHNNKYINNIYYYTYRVLLIWLNWFEKKKNFVFFWL